MRKAALFGLALFAFVLPAQAENLAVADHAVSGFIVPGYERLAQAAELEVLRIGELCQSPSDAALAQARDQFEGLVQAWSRIEIVRFGPVLENNRLERILFWPDRRGIGLKQVQGLLAEKDDAVLTLEGLRQKSVAVQGLGALEFVLYGTGAGTLTTPDGAYRCQYGQTVAKAIQATAEELVDAWTAPEGIAAHMRNPTQENPDYRDRTEVLRELLGVWVHGAEMLRDTRLGPVLGVGDGPDSANPKLGLFWRSNLTVASARWNVSGMRDLFIISGLGDLIEENDRWAAGAYVFELDNFDAAARKVSDQPIAETLADKDGWTGVNYLWILTRSLQNIAVQQLATPLGVGVGFSALDGD